MLADLLEFGELCASPGIEMVRGDRVEPGEYSVEVSDDRALGNAETIGDLLKRETCSSKLGCFGSAFGEVDDLRGAFGSHGEAVVGWGRS